MSLSIEYESLNTELQSLLFTIERICGVEVGSGRVFTDMKRSKEVVDTKHIFAYIAITYLEYSHLQVKGWLGIKYISNITYALKRVDWLIKYNGAYRNRIYNIAVENGVMGLIYFIIRVVDGGKQHLNKKN